MYRLLGLLIWFAVGVDWTFPRPHNRAGCRFPNDLDSDIPIVVADWEKGGFNAIRYTHSAGNWKIEKLPHSEKQNPIDGTMWANEKVVFVIEASHLQPQTKPPQNKSQLFFSRRVDSIQNFAH